METKYDLTMGNLESNTALGICWLIVLALILYLSLYSYPVGVSLDISLILASLVTLVMAWEVIRRLADDYRMLRNEYHNMQCLPFVIKDESVLPSSEALEVGLGQKCVLVGYLKIRVGRPYLMAYQDDLKLRVEAYDPSVHDKMVKAPYYKKVPGVHPLTGERYLEILGENYSYKL